VAKRWEEKRAFRVWMSWGDGCTGGSFKIEEFIPNYISIPPLKSIPDLSR
jgi:hypothetical protein